MLDHLMLGCPDLEKGIEQLYHLTGVFPEPGGAHPGLGTHNALLSLMGPSCNYQYLEIIAPDPQQSIASGSLASHLANLPDPQLVTWAAVSPDILNTARQALKLNLKPQGPMRTTRHAPNGDLLAWQLLFIEGNERGLPFFIDWQHTPHPSGTAPRGCVLKSFEVLSPNSPGITREFEALELGVPVQASSELVLKAKIDSPKGLIELTSHGPLRGFV